MPGKRVLLVDYDPKSLNYTRDVLQNAGFDVSTCGDGLSALDQFKTLSPDLVLLSAMLPKMHGFEVCSNIRKMPGGEKTPVVIITDVYKGKRYRSDAINKYGATEYIEKPIEDANLVSILKGLVPENGQEGQAAAESLDEKTVQLNREVLSQMVKEVPIGVSKSSGEKKIVSDKPKSKDEISRKLEESLAGLELDVAKKPKAKPKSPESLAGVPQPKEPVIQAGEAKKEQVTFTSEDLFTDVIASVERELQSEKIIPVHIEEPTKVEEKTAPAPQAQAAAPAAPLPAPSVAPTPAAQAAPAAQPAVSAPQPTAPKAHEPSKKATFDPALEKKLTTTLSGLIKEKPKEAAQAKASAPAAKPMETGAPVVKPEAPRVQEPLKVEEPAKPQPAKMEAPSAPKVQPPPPKLAPAPRPEPAVAKPVAPRRETPAPVAPAVPTAKEKEVIQEGINFGQYLLLGKIATGGMAELFKAKRKGVEGFEKILAIKRILPHMSDNEEFVTMFIDEAKLAAQLTHHNICQIFDLGKIENSYYIAMEFVHGKDLRAVIRAARAKNAIIPVELAVLMISKICSALDYAHRKRGPNGQPLNLVHRDVSPQNILISYEGEVKLVDFGIAKAATKVHVTQHGALKGKLLYMSPEQAWGKGVDRRTDVFSLGVVLYELLTARPLFFDENDTEVTILEKVREARVPPVREYNSRVPQELEKIVMKALRKSPDERYQVAFEMQKDLDNLFYTEGYNATSASLANFVRSLFPEEWGQELGAKETMVLEKEAPKEAAPVGASVDVAALKEVKAAAPAPSPAREKEPVAPPEPKKVEVRPKAEPVIEPKEPAKPAFRDITAPEIMTTTETRNTPLLVAGGAALAIVIAIVLFFLFRPKPEAPTAHIPAQQQTQRPSTAGSVPQQPSEAPKTEPSKATAAPTENQQQLKEEEQNRKKEEEQKKLTEQKAAEEAKKQEEERKNAEQAKLQEEQQKQAQLKKEAEAKQQAAPAPPPEETKVAQVQPPPPSPVQEQPKQEPEPVKETPKSEPPAAAEPSVNEGDLVDLTPDVTKPEPVNRVNPVYPPAAMARRIEGTVYLSVLISENGSVADAKVLRGATGPGLNDAALSAVRKWKFKPAVKQGKRVKVWMTYPIVFKLQ